MASQLSVINAALGILGREPVADLTAASLAKSDATVKLLRSIETAKNVVLQRHGWLCALTYASLAPAQIPNYSNWRYPFVFLAPGDALRIWEVAGWGCEGQPSWGGPPRWEVGTYDFAPGASRFLIRVGSWWEAQAIADGAAGELNIAYVRRCAWEALTELLGDAIAYEAAWRQCNSITGDKQLAQGLEQTKERMVQMALGEDATQTGGQPPLAPSIPAALRRFAGNAGSSTWGWSRWDLGY
ncbi:MAG: hypothetical protein ACREEW_18170 [Caulobacteraceae bacterium]